MYYIHLQIFNWYHINTSSDQLNPASYLKELQAMLSIYWTGPTFQLNYTQQVRPEFWPKFPLSFLTMAPSGCQTTADTKCYHRDSLLWSLPIGQVYLHPST